MKIGDKISFLIKNNKPYLSLLRTDNISSSEGEIIGVYKYYGDDIYIIKVDDSLKGSWIIGEFYINNYVDKKHINNRFIELTSLYINKKIEDLKEENGK